MRRRPLSKAPCEPEATVNATPTDSQPTALALSPPANTRTASMSRKNQNATAPTVANTSVPQNSARLAADTAAVSPRPLASAIWRVPTVPTPNADTADAVAIRLCSRPIKPMPAGPSNTAATFMRSKPTRILITDAPPMIDDERRIWR